MPPRSSPEPVPYVVFERAVQGLELQVELLNQANARLLDTIDRLTTPQPVVFPPTEERLWVREEEEEAMQGEANGTLSKEEADALRQLAEFDAPIRDQFK